MNDHEKLLNDEIFFGLSDSDIRDGYYRLVADSNAWRTEQLTEKAALISLLDNSFSDWVPKSVIEFSPSGDLYFKTWFYEKTF